jgi:hypothetical protein
MKQRKALAVAALLGLALVPANALASAPAGVWVKVQQVVYSPNATSPTHVQVHGALMLFDGSAEPSRPYPRYTSPAFGYVYYECPEGQAEICRQEWKDLEANIDKAESVCVGFGWDSLPTGTLRQPGSAVEKPDAYPIQNGVSPGFSPCQVIAQFLSSNQGGAGGAGGAASSGGTGGTGPSTGGKGPSAGGTGGTGPSTGGKGPSAGGTGGTGRGGMPGVADPDAGPGGEASASGSGGTTGSDKGGAPVAGRAASGSGNRNPNQAAKDEPAESKAFGCSVAGATGAASLLGLGAALGLVGLALVRRHRSRQ